MAYKIDTLLNVRGKASILAVADGTTKVGCLRTFYKADTGFGSWHVRQK
jgi:hypothetical protein